MANKIEFLKKGDWIVHVAHGLGKVVGMDSKEYHGHTKVFYKVKTEDITYWLPVSEGHSANIRPVRAPSTFRTELSNIRKKPKVIADNQRTRNKCIRDGLTTPSLHAKAQLIRDLFGRRKRRKLNFQDKNILDKLKKHFVREWALVADIDQKEAMLRLNQALADSAKKIEST